MRFCHKQIKKAGLPLPFLSTAILLGFSSGFSLLCLLVALLVCLLGWLCFFLSSRSSGFSLGRSSGSSRSSSLSWLSSNSGERSSSEYSSDQCGQQFHSELHLSRLINVYDITNVSSNNAPLSCLVDKLAMYLSGAGRGTRTPTPSLAPDFESGTSTSSIIPALGRRELSMKQPPSSSYNAVFSHICNISQCAPTNLISRFPSA